MEGEGKEEREVDSFSLESSHGDQIRVTRFELISVTIIQYIVSLTTEEREEREEGEEGEEGGRRGWEKRVGEEDGRRGIRHPGPATIAATIANLTIRGLIGATMRAVNNLLFREGNKLEKNQS